MPNITSPSVIFTAFANPHGDLTNLTREQNGIQDVLFSLGRQGKLKHHFSRTDIDKDTYFNYLLAFKNEISIFHYGGHANSEGLTLQDAHTFFEPMASELTLRNKESLVLVVLNGCSTREHVNILFDKGVKAVIATSVSIEDDMATRFAIRFYENLAKNDDLGTAYASAANYVKGSRNEKRFRHFGEVARDTLGFLEETSDDFPWALYAQDDAVLGHCFFEEQDNKSLEEGVNETTFNKELTKGLIEAILPYSPPARKFWDQVNDIAKWETDAKRRAVANGIIAYSMVGVIGIQLGKLLAIGQEDYSADKPRKYLEKCLHIVKRSLDLVNFALLSVLWDAQKKHTFPLEPTQKNALKKRFHAAFEPFIVEQLHLLQVLFQLFVDEANDLKLPLPELATQAEALHPGAVLEQICKKLQSLNAKLENKQCDLLDCFEAEGLLTAFFQHFAFLADYRMASIKHIGYRQIRNDEPRYVHRYYPLGLPNIDAEKINYTTDTVNTDAVLLYRGENYQDHINLFPFVIDENVLKLKTGSKICFYNVKDIVHDSLKYLFLEDNSHVPLKFKGVIRPGADYNELLLNKSTHIQLNFDCVVAQFQRAEQLLLGA